MTCLLRGGNGAWLQGLRQLQLLILQLVDTLPFNIEEIINPVLRIRDEQPVSYFRELRSHLFGLKYLNSLKRIRWAKFGSIYKIYILLNYPGSATLINTVPCVVDPGPSGSGTFIFDLAVPDRNNLSGPDTAFCTF
jgi:hypothetical protein